MEGKKKDGINKKENEKGRNSTNAKF